MEVCEYLDELPADRRAVVSALRDVIVRSLPAGYEEGVEWGMLSYHIPLERYPSTYNGKPLAYIGLAAQKNYYALHLNCVYMAPEIEQRLRAAFDARGVRLDMGRSCVRFRRLADLPLDVVGDIIAAMTPDEYISLYEATRASPAQRTRRPRSV